MNIINLLLIAFTCSSLIQGLPCIELISISNWIEFIIDMKYSFHRIIHFHINIVIFSSIKFSNKFINDKLKNIQAIILTMVSEIFKRLFKILFEATYRSMAYHQKY